MVLRSINFDFLGLNLGLQPQWNFFWTTNWQDASVWLPGFGLVMIPIISGGAQFAQTIINKKVNPQTSPEGMGGSMGTMMMLMPLLSVWFGFMFPAALGLYWTMQSIIRVGQEVWITKRYTKIIDAEEAVRREEREKKAAELEAKRLETERRRAEGLAERNKNTSKRKKVTSEKQEQIEKAAEWQKKNAPEGAPEEKYEPSRVDNRRYARGRAYDPDRHSSSGGKSPTKPLSDSDDNYDGDDNYEDDSLEYDNYDTDETADNISETADEDNQLEASSESADEYNYLEASHVTAD
jgi:YidC/Oxa1 family membrane protein insertase